MESSRNNNASATERDSNFVGFSDNTVKPFPKFLSSYLWWNHGSSKDEKPSEQNEDEDSVNTITVQRQKQSLLDDPKFGGSRRKRTPVYQKENRTFCKTYVTNEKQGNSFKRLSPTSTSLELDYSATAVSCTICWSIDSVSLQPECLNRLKSGGLLDDSLIEFFFRFLHRYGVPKEVSEKIFFFNSYFYNKLLEGGQDPKARHNAVKRWTNKLQSNDGPVKAIWEYDIIVVPLILRNAHWTLALITFPLLAIKVLDDVTHEKDSISIEKVFPITATYISSNSEKSHKFTLLSDENSLATKKPAIFHLDSLQETISPSANLKNNLISYLQYEFNARAQEAFNLKLCIADPAYWLYNPNIPVPTQQNSYDCGLFLIEYVRHLFTDFSKIVTNLYRSSLLANTSRKWISDNWFSQSTVTLRRKCLRSMLIYMRENPQWANSANHINILRSVFHSEDSKELDKLNLLIKQNMSAKEKPVSPKPLEPSTQDERTKSKFINFSDDEDEPIANLVVSWGGGKKL